MILLSDKCCSEPVTAPFVCVCVDWITNPEDFLGELLLLTWRVNTMTLFFITTYKMITGQCDLGVASMITSDIPSTF